MKRTLPALLAATALVVGCQHHKKTETAASPTTQPSEVIPAAVLTPAKPIDSTPAPTAPAPTAAAPAPVAVAAAPAAPAAVPAVAAPTTQESPEARAARMAWWHQAKFGMFIHWGVYSVPAGTYDGKQIPGIGEWIMNRGKIPVARYAEYTKEFNPVKFDADAWVKLAKDSGMNYIVITSKHHDGFAMYPSKASKFNIYDATPFKRDPLQELAVACRKYGVKLGFYYSQNQDWHHPGGDASGGHWDKAAQDGDYDKYIADIAIPQVKEILTNYGEFPAVLWWDTSGKMTKPNADKLYALTKELKPNIIMNNRLGGGYRGDTETPEQNIPAKGIPGRDWETCMTINGTWGFKSYDQNFKSTETLLRNLIDITSKGGNYLLNVGPTSEGVIPKEEADRLLEIGKWLKVNGEAIYGAQPTVFGDEVGAPDPEKKDKNGKPVFVTKWDWRCTTKPGKIYLHLFKWPENGTFELKGVKGTIGKATLLAGGSNVQVKQDGDKVSLTLPKEAPDKIASVIALDVTDSK